MDTLNTIAMWVGYCVMVVTALAIVGACIGVVVLGLYKHID